MMPNSIVYQTPSLCTPIMLCNIGLMVGIYASSQFDKEPCRTSPLSGREYVAELLTSNERRIYEVFRMPKGTFLDLCDWMVMHAGLHETKKISIEEQLAMFLAIVGHHSTNREVQERFQVSGYTVTM